MMNEAAYTATKEGHIANTARMVLDNAQAVTGRAAEIENLCDRLGGASPTNIENAERRPEGGSKLPLPEIQQLSSACAVFDIALNRLHSAVARLHELHL